MSFSSALLCWLPSFTAKRNVDTRKSASTSLAVRHQVSAPISTTRGASSTAVSASQLAAQSQEDPANKGVDALQHAATGVSTSNNNVPPQTHLDARSSSASVQPRRLIEKDIGPLCLVPHDDPNIPPDRYSSVRFLPYDEIVAEFVEWVQTSPRTAFLRGWPITVDEVWDLAFDVFQYEKAVPIQSRNNFLAALGKHPEVKRENKRVRSERDDRRWDQKRVYRFLTADQIAARLEG